MGQIMGETGKGEMGVWEMGTNRPINYTHRLVLSPYTLLMRDNRGAVYYTQTLLTVPRRWF